jgi:hypothetical protein
MKQFTTPTSRYYALALLSLSSCASNLASEQITKNMDVAALESECREFLADQTHDTTKIQSLLRRLPHQGSISADPDNQVVWIPLNPRQSLICDFDPAQNSVIHGPDVCGPKRTKPLSDVVYLYKTPKNDCY